jgi:hypothetical protein
MIVPTVTAYLTVFAAHIKATVLTLERPQPSRPTAPS